MKQKLAILAVVVAVAALGCWTALAFYNPNVLSVDVAMTGDVAVDGKKPVVFSGSLDPSAPNPKVRVSWIIGKFQMQDASGTAVAWDGFMPGSTDTVYKDYTVGTTFNFTLYAFGVAPSGIDDQAITIEALHNTPMEDTVNFTVVKVDKIEYKRFDLSTWVTDLKIAAGAVNTHVHKAKVRITIVPAKAGVEVTVAKNGGNGGPGGVPGVLSPTTALSTDSSGQVICDYTSSDKIEDLTIKVTELAGCVVSVDLGSTLHQVWDQDFGPPYDFEYPSYFVPGQADTVKYYPTVQDSSGGSVGAINGHSITFYTAEITVRTCVLDLGAGTYTESPDSTACYPSYVGLPASYSDADFVLQTVGQETSPGSSGVYYNEETVNDVYDFDWSSLVFTAHLVMSYSVGVYDNTVYKP